MNDVKPKRAYRSGQRQKQAEATREAVLDAAESLFRKNGWGATTIAAIAREADVSPETIYARFRNKRTIVHELVIRAMRGGQQQTPFMQQEQRARVLTATSGPAIIDAFASDMAELLCRAAPILAVVRSAAETDPEMAELYSELHQARRRNLGRLITTLEETGALRPDLTVEAAGDILWSVVSPELWSLRVEQLGATPETNRDWFRTVLHRLLLA